MTMLRIRFGTCAGAALLVLLASTCGCDHGPTMAPVTGKVLYNGKPLQFGSVAFQPPQGQPAEADIQPDGTFVLSTYRLRDGAVVGRHKVRVACYESQRPNAQQAAGEQKLGRLLIPVKYTLFDQSGLTAEVRESGNEPIVLELNGPAN